MTALNQDLCISLGIEPQVEVTIIKGWRLANAQGYDTKSNFKFDHGLVPRKGETCRVYVQTSRIYTSVQWEQQRRRFENRRIALAHDAENLERLLEKQRELVVDQLPDGNFEVILQQIPVFHRDQMMPGNFRSRTLAFIRFCKMFWRSTKSNNYIKKNPDPEGEQKWWNKDVTKKAWEFEPFISLNENMLREHINHRNIYGVKADDRKLLAWGAIDLDAHLDKGDDPQVFLRQAEAMIHFFHGKGWIICLREDAVTGIHLLKLFQRPRTLEDIQSELVDWLNELSVINPNIDSQAVEAGMKPFKSLEYYPKIEHGIRLPMGRGYTALIDRPLERVHYHTINGVKRFGADVESFMNWDGKEMSIDEKMNFIRQRLPDNSGDEIKRLERAERAMNRQDQKADAEVAKDITSAKVLGPLKGRYRKVLTDFYSGKLQEPKTLQVGILIGINALWAQGYLLEDRTEYLLTLLQDIEVTNPNFSSRLSSGNWDAIETDIDHVVNVSEKLRSAEKQTAELRQSCEKLRAWAKGMNVIGFHFGDRSTWNVSGGNRFNNLDIVLSDDDRQLINQEVRPIFHCSLENACDAVVEIAKVVANKASHGDGISKEYRRAVLTDLGIKCQHNTKLSDCWDILTKTGFLRIKELEQLANEHEVGRARVYGIGVRLMRQFYGEDPVVIPSWLADDMVEAGRSCCWTVAEAGGSPAENEELIGVDEAGTASSPPTPTPPH